MHVVMTKKKRYKFSVELWLNELTAVPFLNAVLFAKVRLLDGGSFVQHSSREEVKDHVVQWGEVFHFQCKMSANANTGVLEPCFCRISVRKEVKGGRSFQKLGMVDLNLAEVAGGGRNARRCLLREYTEKHRLDNSTLNVTINMILLSGDPCFKTPTVNRCWLPGESIDDSLCLVSETMDQFPESIQSRSLIRLAPKNTVVSCSLPELSADGSRFEPSHSRHSSSTSQASRASGESTVPGRGATSSSGPASECSTFERPVDRRKGEESRVQITRVNPDRVVSELVKDFTSVPDESAETSGLQLFVCRDGRTALSSHELLAPGSFLPVVIERKL